MASAGASPGQGQERFWSETRLDGDLHLYRGTLRDAKEGTTGVDIASSWRAKEAGIPRQDSALQTEEVAVADGGSQAMERSEAGTMTEAPEAAASTATTLERAEVDADPGALARKISTRLDLEGSRDEDLAPFLERVSPLMLEELDRNASSTAFSFRRTMVDDRNTTVDLVHVLEPKLPASRSLASANANAGVEVAAASNPHGLRVTQVSWNATGYALAATYGRFDVSGWSDLPGALVVWNLGSRRRKGPEADEAGKAGKRRGAERSKLPETNSHEPDVVIETDVCLQCCSCHPTHPALVAAGAYSGEVYVWNVSSSDDFASDSEVARTRITPKSHHDPVVSVAWRRAPQSLGSNKDEDYQLVSLGMDGKVLVWAWRKGGTIEAPLFGHELVHANPRTHKIITWGGTSLSFWRQQKQGNLAFVAGAEGGGVFRCLLDDESAAGSSYRSPIKASLAPHAGMTTAVASSPFHRGLFVTCGSDSVCKIFNSQSNKPILELEPACAGLFSLSWSPCRPLVFAAGTGDGRVFLYDLAASRSMPVRQIEQDNQGSGAVYSVEFNPKLAPYVATTQGDRVRVWEMGPQLTEEVVGERDGLRKLASSLAE